MENTNNYRIKFEALRNFIRNPDILPTAKVLLMDLLLYAGTGGNSFPSQETLAKDLGLSSRYVRNLIKDLKKQKVLTWKRNGYSVSNRYYFSEELYFLNDGVDRKQSSAHKGNQVPTQTGSPVPTNIVSEENNIISSQLQQLFEETSKKKLHRTDLRRLQELCEEFTEAWVEDAIKEAGERNLPYIAVGLLEGILLDWKAMGGKPPPRPVFQPCGIGKCGEQGGGWIEENTFYVCGCKQNYDDELEQWKKEWGERS